MEKVTTPSDMNCLPASRVMRTLPSHLHETARGQVRSNISGHTFMALCTAHDADWPKSADRRIAHGPAHVGERSVSPGCSLARREALQDFVLPLRAQLARIAFAARFVREEAAEPQQHVAQIAFVVEDHHRAGAQRQAARAQIFERHLHVQIFVGGKAARRAAQQDDTATCRPSRRPPNLPPDDAASRRRALHTGRAAPHRRRGRTIWGRWISRCRSAQRPPRRA